MSNTTESEAAGSERSLLYSDWPTADTFWPATTSPPGGERFVLLAFHGLMGFAYNRQYGYCEVGIHCKAPHHEFKIEVYEFEAGREFNESEVDSNGKKKPMYSRKFGPAASVPVDYLRLDIVKPWPREGGVNFYKPPIDSETEEVTDSNDFRLVPDLEGPWFYDRRLRKKPGAYKPKMHIKRGTFLTLWPACKFRREAPNDSKSLGQIAAIVGAYISLDQGGYVALRIGDEELRLTPEELSESPPQGKYYVVLFDNSCHKEVCKYESGSVKKEKRNDFYLYYETFEIPPDKEEYELHLDEPEDDCRDSVVTRQAFPDASEAGISSFVNLASFLKILAEILSNDDAPCGAIGYGQSGGVGPEGS